MSRPVIIMPADDAFEQHELRRVRKHVRRAEKRGLPATLTLSEWLTILEEYNYDCAYCGQRFESIEHLIPVRHGGGTTATNCVPACEPCNHLSEYASTIVARAEAMDRVGQLIQMVKMHLS